MANDLKAVGGVIGTAFCGFGTAVGGVLTVATLGQAEWTKDMTRFYVEGTKNCAQFSADSASNSVVGGATLTIGGGVWVVAGSAATAVTLGQVQGTKNFTAFAANEVGKDFGKTAVRVGDHFGPDGHLTQALEHVPVAGHVVVTTHAAMGGIASACGHPNTAQNLYDKCERGRNRVVETTAFVPLLGHAQALSAAMVGDDELAAKSLTRSTGVTAAAATSWALAPATVAGAIGIGLTSSAAGKATQYGTEKLCDESHREAHGESWASWGGQIALGGAVPAVCAGAGALASAAGAADDIAVNAFAQNAARRGATRVVTEVADDALIALGKECGKQGFGNCTVPAVKTFCLEER